MYFYQTQPNGYTRWIRRNVDGTVRMVDTNHAIADSYDLNLSAAYLHLARPLDLETVPDWARDILTAE